MTNKIVNILIVEDEWIVAADISNLLNTYNYKVPAIISKGAQVVNAVIEHNPDIILMDIRLADDISGIEAAKEVKKHRDIPIIFLTANSDPDTFSKAKDTLPESFIVKPIKPFELHAAIEVALVKSSFNNIVKEKDQWLKTVISTINEGVIAIDECKKIKFLNRTAEELLHQSSEIFIDMDINYINIFSPDSNFSIHKVIDEIKDSDKVPVFDNLFLKLYNEEEIPIKASLASINSQEGELKGVVLTLQDISLQRKKEKEEKELNEKSEKLKAQFIAQMSHEIRTPLNNILTFSLLLKDEFEDKLPEGLEESFNIIDKSSKRLIRTIELMLNMSKVETGNFEVNYEVIDLNEDILDDTLINYYAKAKNKNILLEYENLSTNSKIIADKYSLEQSIMNLIDNAIKYTEHGYVKIKLFNNDSSELCLIIEDSGIGMSEEFIPHLFTPFSKEKFDQVTQNDGTGLSLALVKKYIEINNGYINVNSKKDKGTTFTLFFKPMKEKNK